ncbi:MAG: phosphotransferase enzyme family protein [Propionibacteriaceae bacterium]
MISHSTTLAAEVAEAFDLGVVRSAEPGGQGAAGRIWRLQTADDEVAVKELFWVSNATEVEPSAIREAAFVEVARAAGISAPAPRADRNGRYVSPLPSGVVRVADWVPGRTVRRDDLGAAHWIGWVYGTVIGLRLPVQGELLNPWYTVPPTERCWRDLVAAGRRHGLGWAGELRRQIPTLIEMGQVAGDRADHELAWSHTDLHPQNVLRRGSRLVLLDWEDAGPVVPVFMLARMLLDWGRTGLDTIDRERIGAVLAGFRSAGGTTEPKSLADFGGLVAGTQNFLVAQLTLTLDPHDDDELRVVSTRQARHLLENPLSAELLQQVLDTVHHQS